MPVKCTFMHIQNKPDHVKKMPQVDYHLSAKIVMNSFV